MKFLHICPKSLCIQYHKLYSRNLDFIDH
jgi:hypothetical protein